MDLGLKGKSAIVTGASRGIGHSIAAALAGEGVSVLLVARDEERLKKNVDTIRSDGGTAEYVAIDLRSPNSSELCVAEAIRAFGHLDVVVNNAGDTKRGNFFELSDVDWANGFSLKFYSYMKMARTAWPHLRARQGSIVNIIGSNANAGHAIFTIGGAVNSALVSLTKSLADIGVVEGVRVNAINPGSILSDRLISRIGFEATTRNLTQDAAAQKILDDYRISRFGRPEEIADMVLFLASGRAGYVQGAIVDVDGGLNRAI